LAKYGHRSFSLDIFHPTFAEEPSQVLRLIEAQGKAGLDIEGRVKEREETYCKVKEALSKGPLGWLKGFVFDKVLILARRYMTLREDQRFYWQRTLAAQRKLFLLVGENLAKEGVLRSREDVFFATKEEIGDYIKGKTSSFPPVLLRKAEFMTLRREYEIAPHLHYPYFLIGNQPLDEGAYLKGRPVSPGISKGKVVIVTTPEQFGKISQGDILVARGIDPGWTPIFSRIGGLIMESGGQLSHGSIVAREYGLPAVASIPNVTKLLRDGQVVVLDGTSGVVTRIT
jgi:pyruvate,water dikinase